MGSGTSCIKYLMFFFNFLIFLSGCALLGLGIWVVVSAQTFTQAVSDNLLILNSAYVLIAVGGVLLLIGFFGCCGAIKENKCMLGTFFTIVLILFIVEIVCAILVFVFFPAAEEEMKESLQKYSEGSNTTETLAWDSIQSTFKCCGYEGTGDYTDEGKSVPDSCCDQASCTVDTAYELSCKRKMQKYFWIFGGVAFGVLVIELLAMIFACCVYRKADKEGGFA